MADAANANANQGAAGASSGAGAGQANGQAAGSNAGQAASGNNGAERAAGGTGQPAATGSAAGGEAAGNAGQQNQGQPAVITAKDLTLPQGIDPSIADQIAGMAKDLGWTKDQAQKFLNRATSPEAAQARQEAQDRQVKAWEDAVQADKDFGGANFEATKTQAKRAVDAMVKAGHLSQADIDFLKTTGYGNHPILVKIAASFGRALGEDGFGGRNAGGGTSPKTDAEIFYGKSA